MNFLPNQRNRGDSLAFLQQLPDSFARVVVFDPQYRGVMDLLKLGNEGARQSERFTLAQMSDDYIRACLDEIERVLKPSGYLFLWLDKFHVAEGSFRLPLLPVVDLLTWDKRRIGMGYRLRRRSEYLRIHQKAPQLAKATWTDHDIADVWTDNSVRGGHPHAKPILLQSKLLVATTRLGDVVIDPAAGSYSVLESCTQLSRTFFGCDLVE